MEALISLKKYMKLLNTYDGDYLHGSVGVC